MRTPALTTPGRFVVGCNYWASHAGTAMWSDWQPEVIEADLRQLSDAGLQVLRVFPLWPDFQPITLLRGGAGHPREYRMGEDPLPDDETGQAGVSAMMLNHFARFADLAEQYGLKLVVGLLTGWMSGRLFVPPALEGLNVLAEPEAVMWEVRFVRCFVRRFKSHPAVLAWDLGNECNVMASLPSPAAAWAWTAAITGAIRAEDPSREIVSGMHGSIDIWKPETLGELTDLLTTHPYPLWTRYADQDPVDTVRTTVHSTAESLLYGGIGGKPCLVEETGTMGPMMASDDTAVRFLRTILYSSWAHDLRGLLWWCAYDQTHLAHAPYDWNACERELGLIHVDRTPKPVLGELGRFRRVLESLPFSHLPERLREAVCLLPLDTDPWALAYSTFLLAKQAGFDLHFQHGEQPLKPAGLYIVPSARGINVITRRRWLALLERVRQGATLYLSLDDALLAEFTATFGLEVQSRQRRPEQAMHIQVDGAGEFTVPAAFRLNLRVAGAKVLGCEPDGNPAFTRFDYGQGEIYFLSAPIERVLTETPGAFHAPGAQPFWQIYRRFAEKHLSGRAVRKQHPMLGLTEHPLPEGGRVVVAINYSTGLIEETLTLAQGWSISEMVHGEHAGASISVPPNDAVVFIVR